MFDIIRSLRSTLAAALVLTTLSPALAIASEPTFPSNGPNPFTAAEGYVDSKGDIVVLDDGVFAQAETVAVQPVYLSQNGGDAAWYDLAMGLAGDKGDAAGAGAIAASRFDLSAPAETGFGFAGHATDADLAVLRVAVGLGHVIALRGVGDEAGANKLAAELRQHGSDLDVLTPDARGAAIAILQGGERGGLHGLQIGRALEAGVRGIAVKERAHGYFAAGIWASSAMLVAARGGNTHFAAMAEPLAVMLDKDAVMKGHDRKIASELRAIATELGQAKPDVQKVRGHVANVLKIARG